MKSERKRDARTKRRKRERGGGEGGMMMRKQLRKGRGDDGVEKGRLAYDREYF
jgi:hypothetical protein